MVAQIKELLYNFFLIIGCKPCDCNQHSDHTKGHCDSDTGQCHCTDNTSGHHCQQCQNGYYGDAR